MTPGWVNRTQAFDFAKYGMISGVVKHILNDAVPDKQQRLRYQATASLEKEWLQAGDRPLKLMSGMSVVADVKTGQRRIIEFFLSPLLRTVQESLMER